MSEVLGQVTGTVRGNPRMSAGVVTALVTFITFALLSPGYLLTLPLNSKEHCNALIPFPDQVVADDCDTDSPTTAVLPICAARAKCQGYGTKAQGYTNNGAAWLHAFLFTIVLGLMLVAVKYGLKYAGVDL